MMLRLRVLLAVSLVATRGLRAQVPRSPMGTDQVIRAAEIARHVEAIASDSMLGRDTPSRGLERTAQYVAAQFKALGLEMVGNSGDWIQRYALPGHSSLDAFQSHLWFVAKVRRGNAAALSESGEPIVNRGMIDFRATAVVATDTIVDYRAAGARGGGQGSLVGWEDPSAPAPIVVAGPHTLESVRQANLRDKVVVYIPPPTGDSAVQRQIVQLLHAANHVVVVDDSAAFAERQRTASRRPPIVLDWYLPEAERVRRWVVHVQAPGIQSALATAGFDLAESRASQAPIVRELDGAAAALWAAPSDSAALTAPNTIGLLRGTGRTPSPIIVVTAHMDDARADTIANAADDNASGVAILIELAKALKASSEPLGQSVVFAAVSGGAKAFWGGSAFLDKWPMLGAGQIMMNVNVDRVGHLAKDTIQIDGLRDVELPISPAWVAAIHPELHLTVRDGGSAVAPVSDHFAFVRRAIPSLYVHGQGHDGEQGASAPSRVASLDEEQQARVLRFVTFLVREVANGSRAPRWTTEGRRQRLRAFGE